MPTPANSASHLSCSMVHGVRGASHFYQCLRHKEVWKERTCCWTVQWIMKIGSFKANKNEALWTSVILGFFFHPGTRELFRPCVDGKSLLVCFQDLVLEGYNLKDVGIYEKEILPGNICWLVILKVLNKLCSKILHSCTTSILELTEKECLCVPIHNCFQLYDCLHPRCFSYSIFFHFSPLPMQTRSVSNGGAICLFFLVPCITFPSASTFPDSL